MLITDKEIALSKFEGLPAINPYFNNDYITHIEDCLEQTIGKIKLNNDNLKVYRIYAAAAMYLETLPDLWLIKKHDSTELNMPKEIIENLKQQQLNYDKNNGIPTTDSNNLSYNTYGLGGIASYLPRIVG